MTKPYVQIFAGTATTYQHSALETQSPPSSPTCAKTTSFSQVPTPVRQDPEEHPDVITIEPNSDVEYADLLPTPRLPGYDYFETLSLVHHAIQSEGPTEASAVLKPILSTDLTTPATIARLNPSCSYVNGVDAKGSLVGEHIVNNLLCIFDAIARGHDDIMLLGHSRGAIAAILAAHELNSIKNDSENDLCKILLKTPCPYTKAALNKLTPLQKQWLQDNSKTIIDSIRGQNQKPATKFTLFGIDPVPGHLWPITWEDARFFKIPPIISEAEIIIMQDERTNVFRPDLPSAADSSKTKMKTTILRGNHSTASGNLGNQQKTLRDGLNKQRRHVQKLTLAKITKMLILHGMKLKQRFTQRFNLDQNGRLKLYQKIHNNSATYDALQKHGYQGLSLEKDKSRLVYTHSMSIPVALDSIIPPIPGYVNSEHLLLSLERLFTLEDNANPVATLRAITDKIIQDPNIFIAFAGQTDAAKQAFKNMMQGLLHTISMTYLRNNLFSEEKTGLITAITKFLQALNHPNPLLQDMHADTINAIKETIDTRIAMLDSMHIEIDKAFKTGVIGNSQTDASSSDIPQDIKISIEQLHAMCQNLITQCEELHLSLQSFKAALDNTGRSTLTEKILLNENIKLKIQNLALQYPVTFVKNIETQTANITTAVTTATQSHTLLLQDTSTETSQNPVLHATIQTETNSINEIATQSESSQYREIGTGEQSTGTAEVEVQTQLLTTDHETQTTPILPQNIQDKITIDFCKNAVEKLKHACDLYLKHAALDMQHIEKRSIVAKIRNLIDDKKSAAENFAALKTHVHNKNFNVKLLHKNLQSNCEFILKILAVLTGLFGIVLAAKRLYDSGGTSANFFKPLSSCVMVEPIDIILAI